MKTIYLASKKFYYTMVHVLAVILAKLISSVPSILIRTKVGRRTLVKIFSLALVAAHKETVFKSSQNKSA